jgi:hypothetical protein
MAAYQFDRLVGYRQSRRFRNISLVAAGISVLLLMVAVLDSVLNEAPINTVPVLVLALLSCIFVSLSIHFHLRHKTRD